MYNIEETKTESQVDYTKRTLCEVLSKKFSKEVEALVKGIPETERESWTKQEHEARNILSDPTFNTPYLNALATARGLGETTLKLAQKVMDNVTIYEAEHAKLLGAYQAEIKRIEAEYQ